MDVCLKGLVVVDYPVENYYRVPNTDAIDAMLDALESDSDAEEFQLNL